jgi:hypothetical protein
MTGMPHESSVGFWLPPTDWLAPTSPGVTAEGARRRWRRRRKLLRASSLLLAFVLLAGGSFLIFGRHSTADAAVVAAVNSSVANRTANVVVTGSGGSPTATFTLMGTGAIDFGHNAMQLNVTYATGAEQLKEQAIYLNGVAYVNPGNALGHLLPGKSWVSLDLGQQALGSPSSSLDSGTGSLGNDPAGVLHALGQDGNTATDIGSSTIDNMTVEGYEVHVDSATIEKDIAQETLPAWLREELQHVSNPSVDYKVYIDGSGLLTRLTTDTTETVSGQTVTDDMTLDFLDYGVPVNVTAPPADQVAPFQSLLQAVASTIHHQVV